MGKDKGGRPPIEFDLKLLESLAGLLCTYAELATALGCCERTIKERMKSDPAFAEAHRRGAGLRKISLRKKQYDVAMTGDRTMLIWLGKQWLDQRDKHDHVHDEAPRKDETAVDKFYRRIDRLAAAQGTGPTPRDPE